MLYYGFVLPDGKELVMNDTIRTHEDLSLKYIKDNGLSKEFRKSSYEDPTDFMVIVVGAIKVGNFARATSITVVAPCHNEFIRNKIQEYAAKGFKVDRIFVK